MSFIDNSIAMMISEDATLITKSITHNGTYDAEDDEADGYSSVTVNVPTITKDLLWGAEDYSVVSALDTPYNLNHNLSDYDIVCVVTSNVGDLANNIIFENMFDVAVCLETNRKVSACQYYERAYNIIFTDTTFTQTFSSAVNESDDYKPYVYKIYGIKW